MRREDGIRGDSGDVKVGVRSTALVYGFFSTTLPFSQTINGVPYMRGDGTGKLYQLDRNTGKLLGWAQTSLGRGQTGCMIHSLHAESDNVLYKGSCTLWGCREDHD